MRLLLKSLRLFHDPSHITEVLIEDKMKGTYEAVTQSLWHTVVFENLFKDLDCISVPTLIIHGSYDSLVPLDLAKRAASKIPNSRLVLIEKAGHFPMIEQPNLFNQTVSQFLSTLE